jgi:hypothetical protein
MSNFCSTYYGVAGSWMREIATGRIGRCIRVEQEPDGALVVCESVDGTRWGAYLDACEFCDKPTEVRS